MSRVYIIIVAMFLVGCSSTTTTKTKDPLYIWNNYSEVSMIYGMNEGNVNIQNRYIQEIETIIKESEDRKKRVPPNLYSEYAYLLYISGKPIDAREYFEKEAKIYPESEKFMKQLIKKLYKDNK